LIPFDKAATLAGEAVVKMITTCPKRCSKHRHKKGDCSHGRWNQGGGTSLAPKGYLTRSVGRDEVAFDHFVEYFFFDYLDDQGTQRRIIIGLGYDSRHWIWTGDVRIPWRVLLCPDDGDPENIPWNIPCYVEKRIRSQNMRDGFTWVEWSGKFKGQDYTFIRIPEKYLKDLGELPHENNHEVYASKLAEAVFQFLDKLFKP